MNIQHIRSKNWREFCEQFTEINAGSLVKIETIGSDGIRSRLFPDAPLNEMVLDKTDACNDVIRISLNGPPDQRKEDHLVIDPVDLQIKESNDGKKILQIRAENGTTLVTFHSGRFPNYNEIEERHFALPT